MGLKLASKYVHCSFIKLHEMHWRFNNPSVDALGEKKYVRNATIPGTWLCGTYILMLTLTEELHHYLNWGSL